MRAKYIGTTIIAVGKGGIKLRNYDKNGGRYYVGKICGWGKWYFYPEDYDNDFKKIVAETKKIREKILSNDDGIFSSEEYLKKESYYLSNLKNQRYTHRPGGQQTKRNL